MAKIWPAHCLLGPIDAPYEGKRVLYWAYQVPKPANLQGLAKKSTLRPSNEALIQPKGHIPILRWAGEAEFWSKPVILLGTPNKALSCLHMGRQLAPKGSGQVKFWPFTMFYGAWLFTIQFQRGLKMQSRCPKWPFSFQSQCAVSNGQK